MNDPALATGRRKMVKQCKKDGIPKEDAWGEIQHTRTDMKFEGHMLSATIDSVYGEEGSA